MKKALLAAALAAALASASAAEAPRVSRPTFIDPDVVSQLPRDLTDRMVKDSDVFYLPDSPETKRSSVGTPSRVRFAEQRADADAAPTPVPAPAPAAAAAAPAAPAEEPRRETRRSSADDARRRRDFEAWEMRRQELQAERVEQQFQGAAAAAPRFAEQQQQLAQQLQQQQQLEEQQRRAPVPGEDDADDGQDADEDLTPAQAQLENNRRRALAAAKAAQEAQARAAANRDVAMRFAEARRAGAGRPLVRAYPPVGGEARGTFDLAGHVMRSRLQRAEARREERERRAESAAPQPAVMLETASAEPQHRRRMFEMSPDELRAAFRAHRASAPAPVAEMARARREAGPADMPRMEAPPAERAAAPAMLEEHGIRVTRYEPPARS